MNAYRITFKDGNTIETEMNATLAEAIAYYIGQSFQFGDTNECPSDNLVEAVKVEAL